MRTRQVTAIGLVLVSLGCGVEDTPAAPNSRGCESDVRLVYTGSAGEEGGDLFGLTADGHVRRLTEDGGSYDPSFSPDGSRIVFSSIGDQGSVSDTMGPTGLDLHVMSADGSGRRRLVDGDEDGAPAWSPDGGQIAFVRGLRPMLSRIMVVDPDDPATTRPLVEPTDRTADADPAWSPDGEQLAFVRAVVGDPGSAPGSYRLVVVDRDGSRPRTILERTEPIGSPSWSPNGTAIAVVLGDPSEVSGELAVVDVSDGSVRTVTAPVRAPAWSSSGRLYAYARPPAVDDFSGAWRVAELVPDGDNFATGLAVPGPDPIGFLYGFVAMDVPRCAGEDLPPLTSDADRPKTLTVEDPASGEELRVLTRAHARSLFDRGRNIPPGAQVESKLVPYDAIGPHPDIDRYLTIRLVWVVTMSAGPAQPYDLVEVFDAATGQFLSSGPPASEAWWDELVDLAP